MHQAVIDGYSECFKVTARGLYAISKGRYYRPEQVQLVNTFRFDAAAIPSDNANNNTIIYIIETSDGVKGTLIDTVGSYSDGSVDRFIGQSEAIRKKVFRHDQHEC